ncbi:MAG: GNAT family acetyltransferase [Planctomycetaceae bacterium]|nr:GNAT family acetyltransferase [Planctomycetaceae bacterium]
MVQIRSLEPFDEANVVDLWSEVFPDGALHNDPEASLKRKLEVDHDLLLVAVVDDRVVGTVMGGYDGHRGWIYSLAVLPKYRWRGIGSALIHEAEERLKSRGCLKVNLQVRASNESVVEFYERVGYHVEERVSMGKRLYD